MTSRPCRCEDLRVIPEAQAVQLQPLKRAFLVGSVRNPCESPLGEMTKGPRKDGENQRKLVTSPRKNEISSDLYIVDA